MFATHTEAGPSRLSQVVTAPSPRRIRHCRHTSLLAFSAVASAPMQKMAVQDDDESGYAGSVGVCVDSSSDPAHLRGTRISLSSVSHRFVPFFLRPMASEMVRPPEVSRPTPPEWCPAVMI
ncbi:uncharacterized protein UMAG_02666 [Mycosarcoma maydis]|uniref:Uncharacterized protein n=1 Tax=Mycosarcoma maydis TaxID=5270 RepID=A0A0D1E4E2_MYCMD|nr:uncharacterized protein UMAG_02666 [Ustilago maydis 521]KIS69325.1 hypothetical protein UMAG_02666 [Ustilago maydis 521]|eukprot:XP_011389051.1 hypothetical protein UMAG_02666 [Ustilago maydis 521]